MGSVLSGRLRRLNEQQPALHASSTIFHAGRVIPDAAIADAIPVLADTLHDRGRSRLFLHLIFEVSVLSAWSFEEFP